LRARGQIAAFIDIPSIAMPRTPQIRHVPALARWFMIG
jgi:hypothetical protein